MPITIVLDQGIPRDAASTLRDLGYECFHVGEVGMSTAADEEILGFALGRNGVVVTVVLANSEVIDKLGVALFASIPTWAPVVRSLDRLSRFLPEPGRAPT